MKKVLPLLLLLAFAILVAALLGHVLPTPIREYIRPGGH